MPAGENRPYNGEQHGKGSVDHQGLTNWTSQTASRALVSIKPRPPAIHRMCTFVDLEWSPPETLAIAPVDSVKTSLMVKATMFLE